MTGPGTVSFNWKADSEAGADTLRFLVDGVPQSGGVSGVTGWSATLFSVAPGGHVLRWAYTKNGSVSAG